MFQKIYAFDRILSQNMFIAVRTSCRKKGYAGALVFELSFLLFGKIVCCYQVIKFNSISHIS